MTKKKNFKLIASPFVFMGLGCLIVLVGVTWFNIKSYAANNLKTGTSQADLNLPVSKLPVYIGTSFPDTTARGVIVLDRNSKMVLYSQNADARMFPASTTKMMTALVVLEHFKDLDEEITVPQAFPIGSNIELQSGEKLTIDQLLYAMLVQSANDAAEVLAASFPGGRSAFISAMNAAAAKYHLNNTFFANPTGIDDVGHHSTAADLARLADVALRDPEFAKIVTIENAVVSDRIISNTNQLMGRVVGVKGIKTGQTEGAGQALVSLVERDGNEIIVVVLGSNDRFGDSERLIEWTYTSFNWKDVTANMRD